MSELLSSPVGWVALGAAGAALIALLTLVVLAFKLRRMRQAQSAVLGDERRDLVSHAERLEQGFAGLREMVELSLDAAERRLVDLEQRLDGCVAHSALVRYDAYDEMSGHQSSSLALLDARRSGVVLSSILHREQARIYVKRLDEGTPELELSPEELEAVNAALATPAVPAHEGNGRH